MSANLPRLPFGLENIALSFSGGGFRAASFSLGCMTVLYHLQYKNNSLLNKVRFISSASGGSITNLAVTLALRENNDFPSAYCHLVKQMTSTDLIDKAIGILRKPGAWKDRPHKSRNIINAFAMAYDEVLFNQKTIAHYWPPLNPSAVEEICINTTEFNNGMLFRFQTDGTDDFTGHYGNTYLRFINQNYLEVYKKIKLADILACSSCFPAGFEPLMFPADFTHSQLTSEELRLTIKAVSTYNASQETDTTKFSFGFMDGGIDDNQGIDSFIKAEERIQSKQKEILRSQLQENYDKQVQANPGMSTEQKEKLEASLKEKKREVQGFGYDFFMSCDVTSNFINGFNFPEENKQSIFLKPSLFSYLLIFLLLTGLSVWGLFSASPWVQFFSCILPGLLAVSIGVAIISSLWSVITGLFRKKKEDSEESKRPSTWVVILLRHKWAFLFMPLSRFLQIVTARFSSVVLLATTVYLKKIRRISYDMLYSNSEDVKLPDGSAYTKAWTYHAKLSPLYLLATKNTDQLERAISTSTSAAKNMDSTVTIEGTQQQMSEFLRPTPEMVALIDKAIKMDTTLWFDEYHLKDDMLATLIQAGQITACFNMLRFANEFSVDPSQSPDYKDLVALRQQLVNMWHALKIDTAAVYKLIPAC